MRYPSHCQCAVCACSLPAAWGAAGWVDVFTQTYMFCVCAAPSSLHPPYLPFPLHLPIVALPTGPRPPTCPLNASRQRAANAPPTPEKCTTVDGGTDPKWAKKFPWSDRLRALNLQYFGNRGFRWGTLASFPVLVPPCLIVGHGPGSTMRSRRVRPCWRRSCSGVPVHGLRLKPFLFHVLPDVLPWSSVVRLTSQCPCGSPVHVPYFTLPPVLHLLHLYCAGPARRPSSTPHLPRRMCLCSCPPAEGR